MNRNIQWSEVPKKMLKVKGTSDEMGWEERVEFFRVDNCKDVSESSLQPVRAIVESSVVEPVERFFCDCVVTGIIVNPMAPW